MDRVLGELFIVHVSSATFFLYHDRLFFMLLLGLCVYIYMCIYLSIHIYMNCIGLCVSMCVCIYIYIYIYIYIFSHEKELIS